MDHIPFGVMLGKNAPGIELNVKFGRKDKNAADGRQSSIGDHQAAGEWASHVVQERADNPGPQLAMFKGKRVSPSHNQ